MSIEKVRSYFASVGMADRMLEFNVSSATVALAAEALGCEPARIAKSLSFAYGDGALLVVAAGDAKVDNAKFKAQFSTKARMLSPEDAVRLIGHAVGGVKGKNEGHEKTVILREAEGGGFTLVRRGHVGGNGRSGETVRTDAAVCIGKRHA